MRAVNLLPEDAQQSRLAIPPLLPTVGVASVIVAASVVAVAAGIESGTVTKRQEQLNGLELRLAQASVTSGTSNAAAVSLLSARDQRLAALNSALSTRVAYDRILRQLSLVLPDDVWLESLQLGTATTTNPTVPVTPGTGGDTTITGYTYTTDGVARLLQRLSAVPTLQDVGLQSATLQQLGTKNVYQFTITATVVRNGAS
jgi:Tfp pilus assembly protein PilN